MCQRTYQEGSNCSAEVVLEQVPQEASPGADSCKGSDPAGVRKPTGVRYSLAKGCINLTLFWCVGEIGCGRFKVSFKQIFSLILRKMAALMLGRALGLT